MVTDNFDDASIDPLYWITNTPVGTITESSGTLNFSIGSGINADWYSGATEYAPIVYTPIPIDASWSFKVKITSFTPAAYKHVGIMLYKDRNNAYLFGQSNTTVYTERIVNDSGSDVAGQSNTTIPVWLKIVINGTTASFYYSTDDSTYTLVNSLTMAFTPEYIGLFAKNWSTNPAINVSFDDWTVDTATYEKTSTIQALIDVNEEDYDDWLWQNEIEITGSPDGQLIDYPVNITVPYTAEFMRWDFGDIRFGTDYGLNLPYFIRRKEDGDYAEFIVKIPVIAVSPNITTLYIYAGNDEAVDKSNGYLVFSLFDHFDENYALGIDTTKWNYGGSISNYGETIEDSILYLWAGMPSNHVYLESKATFPTNYIMGLYAKFDDPTYGSWVTTGFDDGADHYTLGTNYILEKTHDTYSKFIVNNGGTEEESTDHQSTVTPTSYHVYEISNKSTIKENIDFGDDITSLKTISASMYLKIHGFASGAGAGIYVDYVYVRKSTNNEPTIGELGTWATTTHDDIYQALLEIPFYSDSQALVCIRPLREDIQAMINIVGYGSPLIQSLLNITGAYDHNYVNLIQTLLEINEDAGFIDSQAVIRIGNVYEGSLEIKGKILHKSGQNNVESITPGTKTVSNKDENMKFVINLGGRIYG